MCKAGRTGVESRGGAAMGDMVCVGIDVSKVRLDVAVRPGGAAWQVANADGGMATLVAQGLGLAPDRVVLEATGGLEASAADALAAAGLSVAGGSHSTARSVSRAWRSTA